MATPALQGRSITGYTGLNVVGTQSAQVELLTAMTLAADVTLTADQAVTIGGFEVTTGHAANAIIIPVANAVPGKIYWVFNNDATLAALIKVAGGSAITVAATKTAAVIITSAGAVKRLTADV